MPIFLHNAMPQLCHVPGEAYNAAQSKSVQGCDGVEQMRVWLEIYYMSMKWQCRSPMLSVVAVGGEGGGVVFYYNSLMYFTGWKTERLA